MNRFATGHTAAWLALYACFMKGYGCAKFILLPGSRSISLKVLRRIVKSKTVFMNRLYVQPCPSSCFITSKLAGFKINGIQVANETNENTDVREAFLKTASDKWWVANQADPYNASEA